MTFQDLNKGCCHAAPHKEHTGMSLHKTKQIPKIYSLLPVRVGVSHSTACNEGEPYFNFKSSLSSLSKQAEFYETTLIEQCPKNAPPS